MKQLLIALIVLALTLGFCVFSCCHVRSRTADTLADLRLARVQAERGDFTAAADAVLSAQERWNANGRFYQVVLRHDAVDAVATGFASLYSYAQSGDGDDFSATCAELLCRIQRLRRMQLPALENIL